MKIDVTREIWFLRLGYPLLFGVSIYQLIKGYGNVELFTILGVITISLILRMYFEWVDGEE